MRNSKNIDRLFQEKFKDFEASPPPELWENIETKLKGKNKRRKILPIWWKTASVAAILVLFFSIGLLNQSKFSKKDSISTAPSNTKSFKNLTGNKIEIFQNSFSFSTLENNISNFNSSFNNIDLASIFKNSEQQNTNSSASKNNFQPNSFAENRRTVISVASSKQGL